MAATDRDRLAERVAILERWFTHTDLAGLPGLPTTSRGVMRRAEAEGWQRRKRSFGKGYEYPFTALPLSAQQALLGGEPTRPKLSVIEATAEAFKVVDRALLVYGYDKVVTREQYAQFCGMAIDRLLLGSTPAQVYGLFDMLFGFVHRTRNSQVA